MPIYEYKCEQCGLKFELMKKIDEDGGVNCIQCGGCTRRIFSSVPFIFGGTRWVGEKGRKKDATAPVKPKSSKDRPEKSRK